MFYLFTRMLYRTIYTRDATVDAVAVSAVALRAKPVRGNACVRTILLGLLLGSGGSLACSPRAVLCASGGSERLSPVDMLFERSGKSEALSPVGVI